MRLSRLARMDVDELTWRGRAAARIAWERFRASRTPPVWNRKSLADLLAPDAALDGARTALHEERWRDAHRALTFHLTFTPQRFALSSSNQAAVVPAILEGFPHARASAIERAEQILLGRYDLLGYRGLTFQSPAVTPTG